MKVRIVFTGEVKHIPIDGHVAALLRLGIIEEIKESAEEIKARTPEPPRGEARWALVGGPNDSNFSELTITAHCDVCASSMRFNPRPNIEAVNRTAFWHCGHRAGVPADIARTYIANGGGTPEPFADRSFTTRDAAVAAGKVRL